MVASLNPYWFDKAVRKFMLLLMLYIIVSFYHKDFSCISCGHKLHLAGLMR